MVETPVLFLTFARPEYARKSFDSIKKAKPKILYFYSNKGRQEKEGEVLRNNEIRSYIEEIDWDCELHTWFRDEYVDVYQSLLSAKQWAFKNEDRLIMLEEDCLASLAFFQFCDRFLDVYKKDKRINYITGNNYAIGYKEEGTDHYITRTIHHHGWATWKDRWQEINWDLLPEDIIESGALLEYYKDCRCRYLYFKRYYLSETNFIKHTKCWDYIKVINQISKCSYAVTPIYNLVQNIGLKGVHETIESSNRLQFQVSNNEEILYPCYNNVITSMPNKNYDKVETEQEGFYLSFFRYYVSLIYHKIKVW